MAELRKTTLGDLCAEGGGGIQTGPFGSQLHASDYVARGIPSVMPMNIGDNVILEEGIARISPSDAGRLSRYLLATGDIVYSRRGDVEKRALVRPEHDGWLCGTGCLRVRLGGAATADPAFVSYLLGTEGSRDWIVRHAVGATMPNLNTSILSAVPLVLPSLAEQRAIAEVLGALDDKIAANTRLATTADALAASTLRASLSSDMVPLAALALITMGSSPPGTSYNEAGKGVPFFQGVRDFGLRFPRNRVWTTSPVRSARGGDTLVSVRAPVGQVNVARTDLCIGRGLASLRSTLDRQWSLFHLLRDAPDVWAPFEAEGTVFGSINRDQLASLMVPSVEGEVGASVEESLATLEARLGASLAENLTLAATRDALLPALMSGKLRVRDAERLVEQVT